MGRLSKGLTAFMADAGATGKAPGKAPGVRGPALFAPSLRCT
jgi:hypothetical protein